MVTELKEDEVRHKRKFGSFRATGNEGGEVMSALPQEMVTEMKEDEVRHKRKLSFTATGNEGGEEMSAFHLPEEMVETIIAMVPFPSIFKARGLSKPWRARFSSISSLGDELERGLAVSFQKQVHDEWSKNLDTFCPVLIGKEDLIAYGQRSDKCLKFSLSFLPNILRGSFNRCHLKMDGAFLYGFDRFKNLYVADILGQRWKQLPPRPRAQFSSVVGSKIVSNISLGTYKVLLFCRDYCLKVSDVHCAHGCYHYSAKIYESNSDTWSTQNFAVTDVKAMEAGTKYGATSSAYLNGVLYTVAYHDVQSLLAFDLAEGKLYGLKLAFDAEDVKQIEFVYLLVCNDERLMMVTIHPEKVQVLEVNFRSLQLVLKSLGPHALFSDAGAAPKLVSRGNWILFCAYQYRNDCYNCFRDLFPGSESAAPTSCQKCQQVQKEKRNQQGQKMLAYDVDEDVWNSILVPAPLASIDFKSYKWIGASFQPGLSAFVRL